MPFADPFTITIPSDRQRRTEVDRTSLKGSLSRKGQIHAIVLRKVNDELTLVSGEQRLRSFQELKAEGVPVARTHDWKIEYKLWSDLSPREAKVIELEENAKRVDLPWRENVQAIGELHKLYLDDDPSWTLRQTGVEVSLSEYQTQAYWKVFKNLDNPALRDCTGFKHAFSALQTLAERRAAAIVSDIAKIGATLFSPPAKGAEGAPGVQETRLPDPRDDSIHLRALRGDPAPPEATPSAVVPASPAVVVDPVILNTSFLDWTKTYAGPKFNLLHCDFPYDVEYRSYAKSTTSIGAEYDATGFDDLLTALCENTDKLASYSAHLIFWFSMRFYDDTRRRLSDAGWFVHYRPLVWAKSDNAGIIPGTDSQYPRWTYETALLASRGKRPLVKQLADHYSAPNSSNPIHPSQKPEPVLKHFLGMVVDQTTDVLDPTCGSGSALRAADTLGARSVLGLEIAKDYADAAEAETQKARRLRHATETLSL